MFSICWIPGLSLQRLLGEKCPSFLRKPSRVFLCLLQMSSSCQFRFSSIANSYDFTVSLLTVFFKEIISQFSMAILSHLSHLRVFDLVLVELQCS